MTATEDHSVTADGEGPRPLRKDAARNRELLVAAGREVFARRGLEASLDEIARQAGVGVATAYRHFGNKFELAEAIMHEAIDEVVAAAQRAAEAENSWAGLVGFLEEVLELQTQDRGLREVMMGVQNPHKSAEVYERLSPLITTVFERAQHDGEVRSDASVSDLGCIITMLNEVSDLAGDTAPTLWRRYLGVFLAGLRPDGPALDGPALTDEQFRSASETHHAVRLRQAHPT
jgi:AcrR family transcriptional regulator